jgi:ParB/RepB/Spo0J family partition protein
MNINKSKFTEIKEIDEHTAFARLKLSEATVSHNNIREELQKEDIEIIKVTLMPSIETLGLAQLPLSTPEGEIFAGSRRLTAYKELQGKSKTEFIPVIIKDVDDKTQIALSWSENRARKETEPLSEARKFKQLKNEHGMSEREIGVYLGIPHTYVSERLQILGVLSQDSVIVDSKGLTKEQEKKSLTTEKAKVLSRDWVPKKTREKLVKKIKDEGLSHQELQRELGKGKVVQTIIEEEEKPEVKAQLEQEYGGDKSFEVEPETVLEKQRELKGLAPSLTKIELPAEDFETDTEKIDVQIHPKVMQRIVKYFLDKKGRYISCEVIVIGEVAKSEKD